MEFHSNRGDITEWLEEAESRVDLLEARGESYEVPLVSPVELLNDTKVCKRERERESEGGREGRRESVYCCFSVFGIFLFVFIYNCNEMILFRRS